MGKAKKNRRFLRKLFQDVVVLQRTRYTAHPKKPCETCAFRDPEAWIADQAMRNKVLACLKPGGPLFYCHDDMPVEDGRYQPPRTPKGVIDEDRLTPCGGFVPFAQHWWDRKPEAQAQEVERMQRRMLRRWLVAHPACMKEMAKMRLDRRVELLQTAVQFMAGGSKACRTT